jgi:hypothetical protein
MWLCLHGLLVLGTFGKDSPLRRASVQHLHEAHHCCSCRSSFLLKKIQRERRKAATPCFVDGKLVKSSERINGHELCAWLVPASLC